MDAVVCITFLAILTLAVGKCVALARASVREYHDQEQS